MLKGKVLRNLPRWIQEHEDYWFHKGDIVKIGYHTEEGEESEVDVGYYWVEESGWNPAKSLDYLTADDVEVIV
jgi:hypothetical protein